MLVESGYRGDRGTERVGGRGGEEVSPWDDVEGGAEAEERTIGRRKEMKDRQWIESIYDFFWITQWMVHVLEFYRIKKDVLYCTIE